MIAGPGSAGTPAVGLVALPGGCPGPGLPAGFVAGVGDFDGGVVACATWAGGVDSVAVLAWTVLFDSFFFGFCVTRKITMPATATQATPATPIRTILFEPAEERPPFLLRETGSWSP